jgi:hypothetical protein
MRGSPLFQAGLLAIALALAGIPVWSLTRPHEHPLEVQNKPANTGLQTVEFAVTSTAPAVITLAREGQVIWESGTAGREFAHTLEMPAAGGELVATVRWPGGENQAARFQFSHDGESLCDATLWGTGETTDVLTLSALP